MFLLSLYPCHILYPIQHFLNFCPYRPNNNFLIIPCILFLCLGCPATNLIMPFYTLLVNSHPSLFRIWLWKKPLIFHLKNGSSKLFTILSNFSCMCFLIISSLLLVCTLLKARKNVITGTFLGWDFVIIFQSNLSRVGHTVGVQWVSAIGINEWN